MTKQRTLGHSDAPIQALNQDTLGLGGDARSLAEFVVACCTPLTIAIQGDWGSGKTSLLRMIECELQPSVAMNKIAVIRFETWQYAQFGSSSALPVSLLSLLLRRLAPDGAAQKAVNVLKRLAGPVGGAAVRIATFGASELGDFTTPPDPVDQAEENEKLRSEIEEAINRKLAQGYDRIVVFIDDLDRIEAERAVEILETIKMFLDCKGCVFLLAMDYAVVREGVRKKFGIEDDKKSRSFFDKIIQLPFVVPVGRYDSSGFILDLLADMSISELADDYQLLVELTKRSVSSNPRSVKRVLNSFQLQLILARHKLATEEGEGKRHALRILFGLLCLQSRFPAVYDWLLEQPIVDQNVIDTLRAHRGPAPGLSAADQNSFTRLHTKEDEDAYRLFSPSFLESLQNPVENLSEIDDVEIARINGILQLTRATSVPTYAKHDARLDEVFQSANREMMARAVKKIEEIVGSNLVSLKTYQPADREEVQVYWMIPDLGVGLTLGSAPEYLRMWAFGSTSKINKSLPYLVMKLSNLFPLCNEISSVDGEITLWTKPVLKTTTMEERERLLADEGHTVFAKAVLALRQGR